MNGCAQRKLNTHSQGTNPTGFPFVPKIAHLGQGDMMFLWRTSDKTLGARSVDREGSMCYGEIGAHWKEDFPSGNCFNQITQAGLAATSTGNWLVALGYRWGSVVDNPFPTTDERHVWYRLSFAAYNRKIEQVKGWTDLRNGQVYNQLLNWKPACTDLPNAGTGWPDDSVEAFSFSDGAYGILAKVQDEVPEYWPVSSSFSVGSKKQVLFAGSDKAYRTSGCVLPNDNIALVWWYNGLAGMGVVDRNMAWKFGQVLVAETSGEPKKQYFPRCSALPNGRFVVAFNSYYDGGQGKLYLQTFNSDGSKYGGLLQPASGGGCGHAMGPAAFSDSGWAMAWHQVGLDSDQAGVGARIYNASNSPLTNAFLVNDVETGFQIWTYAMAYQSQWTAFWGAQNANKTHDYFFKLFSKSGEDYAAAPERRLHQETSGDQRNPEAAATDNGFAAVWESDSIDGNASGIGLRLFNAGGAPASQDIMANETVEGMQREPAVAFNTSQDRVMVVWTSEGQVEGSDVFSRVFDAQGTPLTGEVQINQTSTGEQYQPSVASAQGGFAVAWTSDAAGTPDTYARIFDLKGNPMGDEFAVNQSASGKQVMPRVLSSGESSPSFVVTWSSSDAGVAGLYARRMNVNGTGETGDELLEGINNLSGYSIDRHSSGAMAACFKASNVSCRYLDAQLKQVGNAFQVATSASAAPAVVMRAADRIWVMRDDVSMDSSGLAVMLEELDASGKRVDLPILVNWYMSGDQSSPFATLLPGPDNVLVGWQSSAQDGSGQGIYFRVLD